MEPTGSENTAASTAANTAANNPANKVAHPPRTNAYVYLVIAVAAVGGLLFGYDTGIAGGAAGFVAEQYKLSGFMEGMVVSTVLVGGAVGALLCGPVADRRGRRPTIIASGLVFAVGALMSAAAPTLAVLLVSRVVIGVGVGAVSVLVPVYIAELAPPRVRGALVSGFQLLITIGILIAYGVNAAFADTQAWRWSLGLAAVPGVLLALGILAVPESPRWLVTAGRTDQARAVLGRLRGAGGAGGAGGADAELAEIARVGREHADQADWRDVFAPRVRRRLVVGMLMAFFAQVCGINAVIYFAPQILQSSGFDSAAALLATVGLGVVNVLVTVVGMLLVDRVGRKPMLAVGVLGMTVSLAVLAATFTFGSGSGWVAFACLAVYIVAYAVSPGMLCFVVISEIFPLHLRGKATSLSLLVNFVANLIVALAFLPMLLALGTAATFWVFVVVCAAFLVYTIALVPETKGRSLEEVERDLG